MPLAVLLLAIDVSLMIHAAKTGRFSPWGYIILMVPGFGAAAYVAVELLPAWFGTYQGQQVKKRVGRALDPEKTYRALRDQLEVADTISTRFALAEECLALEKFDEALIHYDAILAQPLGEEPLYALGRARALFGQGRAAECIAALDDLRQRWPDYPSPDGHLLYARALEGAARLDEAVSEYRELANYYAGAEPRVRLGLLLRRLDREAEAKTVLADVIVQMRRAPRFARKVQADWIAMAEKALRT